MMQCTEPTYDPRLVVRLLPTGCVPTHLNSTELPFRRTWSPSMTVSDMSRACFWPCSDLRTTKETWLDAWSVWWILVGLVGVLVSRSAARSRSVWIALGMLFSVFFSVVIIGYATSRLWKNELSYSGVGTLTAVQVLAGFVLQKAWSWVEEYTHWVAVYVGTVGLLGLALSRGFLPDEVDARAATVLETVWVFVCVGMHVYHTPSVIVAGLQCVVALYLKSRWDARDLTQYHALAALTTRTEVAKLMDTPEFRKWFLNNHMRVRVVR